MHAYRSQVHLRESVPLWAWELNLSDLAASAFITEIVSPVYRFGGFDCCFVSLFFFFMCANVLPHLPAYILVHSIFAWHSRQEEALKLELWKVVSYHMGNGNQTQTL